MGRYRKYKKYKKAYKKYKKLSNKYIYGKKGAAAQAMQIAALRDKINKVYKVCKPEVKFLTSSVKDFEFKNGLTDYSYKVFHLDCCDISTGDTDHDRTGDKVRTIGLEGYLNAEYVDNIGSSTTANEGRGGTLRFIYLQCKRSKAMTDATPAVGSIIDGYEATGNGYQLNTVRPLARGITETYKVLSDSKITLTYDKPIKTYRFKIPDVNNLRYLTANAYTYNLIYCVVIATGFRFDSEQLYSIKLQIQHKFIYSDA